MSLMLHRAGLLRPSLSPPAPTAPDAFATRDWSIAPGDEKADITISALPGNGGAAITDIEYRLDGGAWVSSGGTSNFTITGLTNDQAYDVELRAVNSVGAGAPGDTKQVTPESASAPFHPLDLAPELFFQISDLATLKQERTGASATTPAGVGDPVGSIRNLGTLGGWATATADSRRMILRQTGGGKYYLEADGADDAYALSLANSVGARTSVSGVRSSGNWVATTDAGGPANGDCQVFAGDLYIGCLAGKIYTRGAPNVSSGSVVVIRSGPGATPEAWINGGPALGGFSDAGDRGWNASIAALFAYSPTGAAGAAHYFGYFSRYADLPSGDRNAVEAWMASQMGL